MIQIYQDISRYNIIGLFDGIFIGHETRNVVNPMHPNVMTPYKPKIGGWFVPRVCGNTIDGLSLGVHGFTTSM